MPLSQITAIEPLWAIEGGRISLRGSAFQVGGPHLPQVHIGNTPARVVCASSRRIDVLVPDGVEGGRLPVRIDEIGAGWHVEVAGVVAAELHQVDNPVFDRSGNLYVTYSGTRGEEVAVS